MQPGVMLACGILLLLMLSSGAPGDGRPPPLSSPLAAVITLLCAPATILLSALIPSGPILHAQAYMIG